MKLDGADRLRLGLPLASVGFSFKRPTQESRANNSFSNSMLEKINGLLWPDRARMHYDEPGRGRLMDSGWAEISSRAGSRFGSNG